MTVSLFRTALLRAYQPSRSTLLSLPLVTRSRLLSTTSSLAYPIGSGKGGKADKDAKAAEKAAKEKEKAAKAALKAKEDAKKAKVREDRLKLKEKKAKEAGKRAADKEKKLKEKAKKERAKQKLVIAKEKKLKLVEKKKALRVKAKAAKEAAAKRKPTSRLHPPKGPQSAWQIYLAEFSAQEKAKLAPGEKGPGAPAWAAQAAPLYRELSHSERSEYLAKAKETSDAYPALLEAWKASLSASDIKEENVIRRKRRKLGLSNKKELRALGEPKKPANAYALFTREATSDPDQKILGGMSSSIVESSKLIAAAWKTLTPEDKQTYLDQAAELRAAYKVAKADFDAEQERKEAERASSSA